jgi:hypothetical protein
VQRAETMDHSRVLRYLLKRMEPLRCVPFVLIYGCATLGDERYPDTNFMQSIFDLYACRYSSVALLSRQLPFRFYSMADRFVSLRLRLRGGFLQIQRHAVEVLHHARVLLFPDVLLAPAAAGDHHVRIVTMYFRGAQFQRWSQQHVVFSSPLRSVSSPTLYYFVQVLELLYEPLQHPQLTALHGCKHVPPNTRSVRH